MSLTLITGRANTGKTDIVHEEVRRALSAGLYPVLLLPTAPDAVRSAAALAARGIVGVDVRQIRSWIADLWGLYGDGRAIVDRPQRLTAARIVADGEDPRFVRDSARRPGFPDLLARIAARLALETADWTASLHAGSPLDAEMARLLGAYRERLEGMGLVEPGEAAHLLARQTVELQGPVLAHRFDDLDPSQEALLTGMARSNDVHVCLTWEQGFAATEALDHIVSRLSAVAQLHTHLSTEEPSSELRRLESWLFRAPEPHPPGGRVRFCTATGLEAECALVAEEAAEASAAFGPDRVAIVFRDPSDRVQALDSALAAAGVPAAMDVMVPVLHTPFGRALGTLLGAASGTLDPAGMITFMRGPFSGADPSSVDRLDARWRSRASGDPSVMLREAARLGRLPARSVRCARRLSGAGSTPDDVRIWKQLVDAMLRAAHEGASFAEDPDAALDAAAHAAVLQTAASLVASGHPCSWPDMKRSLERERVSSGAGERAGCVQVTEARRLRSRRFDAVIVGGLTAGDFSAEGRASGAEEIAERLLGGDGPSRQSRDRLLFYGVCTRARERLVLVRQTADADGTLKRPSVFWEEALDLYRPAAPDLEGEHEDGPVARTVRLSDLERVAPAYQPGRMAERLAAGAESRSAASHPAPATPLGRALRDPEVLAGLAARDEFSATELEKYARCPHRWFYERMVRPEGLDVGFGAMERGDIAHRVLAAFYTQAPGRLGSRRVTRQVLPDALDLLEHVFDEVMSDPHVPSPRTLLERDELARTRTELRALVASEPDFLVGFEPAHAELRFGTPRAGIATEGAPYPGAVDLGGFRLRGSIDRIDEGPAGLVVVDYKSGSKVPKRADFERDCILQVPLYAAAARVLLGRPVLGGLYRSIRSGEARGFYQAGEVLPAGPVGEDALSGPEEVAEVLEWAVATARAAALGIRAGRIEAVPSTPKACDHCAAQTLCGAAS